MTAELEKFDLVPNTVEKEWKEKKRLWSDEQKRLEDIESKVEEAKAAANRYVSAFEAEAASLATKQEKLSTRLAKLKADMDKLKNENATAQLENVKKKADREALVNHRATMEQEFSSAISKMEKRMQEYRALSSENWEMLENAATALQAQQCSTPLEGSLPGVRGSLGPVGVATPIISTLNTNLMSTPPGLGPVMANLIPSNPTNHRRDRASSMFTGDGRAPSFAGITPRDRPSLSSLNSFGGFGSGLFEGGIRRSNSQNTRSSLGSIGAVNAAPGFEKFGSGTISKGNSVLDR